MILKINRFHRLFMSRNFHFLKKYFDTKTNAGAGNIKNVDFIDEI